MEGSFLEAFGSPDPVGPRGFGRRVEIQPHGHRNVLERASARTAARVAAGTLAAQLLGRFGITLTGYIVQVGRINPAAADSQITFPEKLAASPVRTPDPKATKRWWRKYAGPAGGNTLGVLRCWYRLPARGSQLRQWDRHWTKLPFDEKPSRKLKVGLKPDNGFPVHDNHPII